MERVAIRTIFMFNRNGSIASSHVGTPDPRQSDPLLGQQLLVSWDFPRSIFEKHLQLFVTVRLWDCTQTTTVCPISRKRDYEVFFFPNPTSDLDKKILTYQVQAISDAGEIVGYWEHPFWTKLVSVGKEESF